MAMGLRVTCSGRENERKFRLIQSEAIKTIFNVELTSGDGKLNTTELISQAQRQSEAATIRSLSG
jgi:hypothetical protein